MNNIVYFISGRSGGHIIPLIEIASRNFDIKNIHFFATDSVLEKKIFSFNNSYQVSYIPLPPIPSSCKRYIEYAFLLTKAYIKINNNINSHFVEIHSTGGYLTVFVVFFVIIKKTVSQSFFLSCMYTFFKIIKVWCRTKSISFEKCWKCLVYVFTVIFFSIFCIVNTLYFFQIPYIHKYYKLNVSIYCLDVIPAKSLQFLSYYARNCYVVFEEAQKYLSKNAILIPYPLKYQEKDRIKDPVAVKKHLGIMQDKKILLILGGSQGSQEVIEKVYNLFLLCSLQERSQYELIIQSGNNNPEEIKKKFFQSGIIVNTFSFVDDMSSYYIIADKVITRGGAGTLFELVFFKKQSFIIPLRSVAQDHQFLNAISMCKKYDFLKTEENYTLQEFLFS